MPQKDGALYIDEVSVPESVESGRSVTAEVKVVNDASFISPLDDDQCQQGGFASNYGFETTVIFEAPDGSTQEKTACVVSDDFHAGESVFEFTFTPSESGMTEVQAQIRTSEGTSRPTTASIAVGSDAPAEPDDDEGDPWWSGGLNDDGDGDGDGGDPLGLNPFDDLLGPEEKLALGVLALLIAAAVLRPYASMGATTAKGLT